MQAHAGGETVGISWIEHKGKRILFEDYSGLVGDEMLEVLYASEVEFKKQTSPILVLLDFTDSHVNQKFMDELKRLGKEYDALIEKSASAGVTGFKRALAVAYNLYTGQGHKNPYFDSLEEAKDWLCE